MTGISRVRGLLQRRLVQNVLILYGVYLVRYGAQGALIAYLARVLQPAGLGEVAAAQSLGIYLNLIVEYGFVFSAAREVARKRDSLEARSVLLASVLGAKLLLTVVAGILAAAAGMAIPIFSHNPVLLWTAAAWGVSQALYPLWYFQGLERMRLAGAVDMSFRLLSLAAVVALVRGPTDTWKVFAVQAACFGLMTAIAMARAYSEVPFVMPSINLSIGALRDGFHAFLVWSAASFYTAGNALILTYFAPVQSVGYYAGAERLVRPITGLLHPINASVMPRMSRLAHSSPQEASRLIKLSARVMLVVGLLLSAAVFISAPALVHFLLGDNFGPSVTVMRILALLPALFSISHILGIQWMIPRGMERAYGWTLLAAGVFNIALAVVLAPRLAQVGMAWTAVAAEAFVALALFAILRRGGPLFSPERLPIDDSIAIDQSPL